MYALIKHVIIIYNIINLSIHRIFTVVENKELKDLKIFKKFNTCA